MDAGNRFRTRTNIARLITPWIASRTLSKVAEVFDKFGVCWSHYQTLVQMAASAAVNPSSNSMFSAIEQPGVGRLIAPAIPLDFSLSARPPAAPAPRLGEHTEAVLLELLGITSAEYGRLHDKGVVSGSSRHMSNGN
jgi:2-methylfumaryl-CoA isomerase